MALDRRATRLGVLALVGVILISLLGVRLWFLQTVKADELQESVTIAKTRQIPIAPERGRIFDADMRILADNQRVLHVGVDFQVLRRKSQRDEIFRRLSGWVGVPPEVMEENFDPSGRSVDPFRPYIVREDIDEPTAIALLERIEDFPGVQIVEDWERVYPYAPHAAHVVGYMGAIGPDELDERLDQGYLANERVGQFGIEREMERVLHGTWGFRTVEVDGTNRPVRVIEEVPPINGFDVQLTIDLDQQVYAEQLLETTLRARRTQRVSNPTVTRPDGSRGPMDPSRGDTVAYKAPAGSTVIMNYDTGDVVAIASYPTFDNRWFEADLSSAKFKELFDVTDPETGVADPDLSTLVNRAIQGRYNLGSTFKLFTAYAALNTGLISAGEIYQDTGTYTLSREAVSNQAACDSGLIRCEFRNAICSFNGRPCIYGDVNVEDSLAVSSDTFYYRIGDRIMVENDNQPILQEQVEQFGFGADTGIELPFEFDGTVPDAELKRRYADLGVISEGEGVGYFVADNVQLAIGQGLLSATPLQLATGYGAVANGGFVMQPSVIKAIWEPGTPDGEPGFADPDRGTVFRDESGPDLIRQVRMPDEIRAPMVRGLRRVVTGPGKNGRSTTAEELFDGYPSDAIQVAGKTGTAQGQGNYPWNDSSVFTGFAVDGDLGPDDENPYVVTAYLEKAGFGSQAAAPVVKCMFLMLSGKVATDPVVPSEPLDFDSNVAAPRQVLDDTSCWIGRDGNAVILPRRGAVE